MKKETKETLADAALVVFVFAVSILVLWFTALID